MKKLIKIMCAISALCILFAPAFAAPDEQKIEEELQDCLNDPGHASCGYYMFTTCFNPDGNLGDVRIIETCPNGTSLIGYVCQFENGTGGVFEVPRWLPFGTCEEEECSAGYAYDSSAGKCRLQCDDGKFVDNKLACQEVAIIEQVCSPGTKGYQTCEKNGVDCGTQERTCSTLGQWPAIWGECKVL